MKCIKKKLIRFVQYNICLNSINSVATDLNVKQINIKLSRNAIQKITQLEIIYIPMELYLFFLMGTSASLAQN
jgi:hypothetical protein